MTDMQTIARALERIAEATEQIATNTAPSPSRTVTPAQSLFGPTFTDDAVNAILAEGRPTNSDGSAQR